MSAKVEMIVDQWRQMVSKKGIRAKTKLNYKILFQTLHDMFQTRLRKNRIFRNLNSTLHIIKVDKRKTGGGWRENNKITNLAKKMTGHSLFI